MMMIRKLECLVLCHETLCPFVHHISTVTVLRPSLLVCVHPVYTRTGNQTCNSVAALMRCDGVALTAASAPEAHGPQHACEKTLQEPGSKSSAYSYSSRSRLQCGVGISKKCLFVRPSSLEMCCPKGLKGFSYLHRHMEKDNVRKRDCF